MNTDLAEAVKEAQEALEQHDIAVAGDEWSFAPISLTVADALRSLLAATEPAPALPEEVREAAERVRKHFHVFPPSPDEILTPFGEDVADLLSALSHSATVAGAPTSWPERHAAELRAACGNPENWPQCVAGDWIETMVQTAGWVCGKCGHQPGHPCHGSAKKPPAPPAAPAPGAVREAAERLRGEIRTWRREPHGSGANVVSVAGDLLRALAARGGRL